MSRFFGKKKKGTGFGIFGKKKKVSTEEERRIRKKEKQFNRFLHLLETEESRKKKLNKLKVEKKDLYVRTFYASIPLDADKKLIATGQKLMEENKRKLDILKKEEEEFQRLFKKYEKRIKEDIL